MTSILLRPSAHLIWTVASEVDGDLSKKIESPRRGAEAEGTGFDSVTDGLPEFAAEVRVVELARSNGPDIAALDDDEDRGAMALTDEAAKEELVDELVGDDGIRSDEGSVLPCEHPGPAKVPGLRRAAAHPDRSSETHKGFTAARVHAVDTGESMVPKTGVNAESMRPPDESGDAEAPLPRSDEMRVGHVAGVANTVRG